MPDITTDFAIEGIRQANRIIDEIEKQMDREKVITGLELCTNISPDGCLMLCPYKDEKDETYSGFCEHVLKQDALALLKSKQPLPVKCEERKTLYSDDPVLYMNENFYFCPCCGKTLSRTHKRESILYCDNCGQALDWEEGDRE